MEIQACLVSSVALGVRLYTWLLKQCCVHILNVYIIIFPDHTMNVFDFKKIVALFNFWKQIEPAESIVVCIPFWTFFLKKNN